MNALSRKEISLHYDSFITAARCFPSAALRCRRLPDGLRDDSVDFANARNKQTFFDRMPGWEIELLSTNKLFSNFRRPESDTQFYCC